MYIDFLIILQSNWTWFVKPSLLHRIS